MQTRYQILARVKWHEESLDNGELPGVVKRNTRLEVKFSLRFATRRYQATLSISTSYVVRTLKFLPNPLHRPTPDNFRPGTGFEGWKPVSSNEIRKCSWRNNLVIWNGCVWNRYPHFDLFCPIPLRTKHATILLSRCNGRTRGRWRWFSLRKERIIFDRGILIEIDLTRFFIVVIIWNDKRIAEEESLQRNFVIDFLMKKPSYRKFVIPHFRFISWAKTQSLHLCYA